MLSGYSFPALNVYWKQWRLSMTWINWLSMCSIWTNRWVMPGGLHGNVSWQRHAPALCWKVSIFVLPRINTFNENQSKKAVQELCECILKPESLCIRVKERERKRERAKASTRRWLVGDAEEEDNGSALPQPRLSSILNLKGHRPPYLSPALCITMSASKQLLRLTLGDLIVLGKADIVWWACEVRNLLIVISRKWLFLRGRDWEIVSASYHLLKQTLESCRGGC